MSSNQALVLQMKKIFKENGAPALIEARKHILSLNSDNSLISQSLRHFSKVTLHNTMPVFPALINISCEAVGGNSKQAVSFGKAIVLITGAADIHDDIIDKSFYKGPKQTVLGKFGFTTTILSGDILLAEGLTQLNDSCEMLSKAQGRLIRSLVSDAIKEISIAETLEGNLKACLDLPPDQFIEIIRLKAVVPELAMKIGAIVGRAKPTIVEKLGKFGRIYGIVSIVSDECADVFDPLELTNRLKNECPPLPLIYALQNLRTKLELIPLLNQDFSNNSVLERIIDLTFGAPMVKNFLQNLMDSSAASIRDMERVIDKEKWGELKVLISAPLSYFC